MNEAQIRFKKLKKLFNIKENNHLIEMRIKKFMENNVEQLRIIEKKDRDIFVDKIHTIIDNIEFELDNWMNQYEHLTRFELYKIFKQCLTSLDELYYFEDREGTTKNYDTEKILAKIEYVKKYIQNPNEIKIRIPKNPNDTYNDFLASLKQKYKISRDDSIRLLSYLYGTEKKAKRPDKTKREMLRFKKSMTSALTYQYKLGNMDKKELESSLNTLNELHNKLI